MKRWLRWLRAADFFSIAVALACKKQHLSARAECPAGTTTNKNSSIFTAYSFTRRAGGQPCFKTKDLCVTPQSGGTRSLLQHRSAVLRGFSRRSAPFSNKTDPGQTYPQPLTFHLDSARRTHPTRQFSISLRWVVSIAVKLRINVIGRSKKGGYCPPKKAAEPHALYMEQRPSGEAAIIITHFLLVAGAHPFRHPRVLLSGIQDISSWHFVYKEVAV